LVQTQPSVLSCSIDENLKPKVAWVRKRFELDDKGLSKLVKTQPSALSCGIEQNIEPKLA
jgi:hypothetical protein